MSDYKIGVIIGRFQGGPHYGHLELIGRALKENDKVVILLGSSNLYPSIENPLSWNYRATCIHTELYRTSMITNDGDRVSYHPINDYRYNDIKWVKQVHDAVRLHDSKEGSTITMYGHEKDSDSYWLKLFPEWNFRETVGVKNEHGNPLSSTHIRRDIFNRLNYVSTGFKIPNKYELSRLGISKDSYQLFLDLIESNPRLIEEWIYWETEKAKFKQYPYQGHLHCLCADVLLECASHVVLIKRKQHHGKGAWALPGGHKSDNESFKQAAIRELREEVRVKVPEKVLLGSIVGEKMFDHPKRCPVINKPSMAYHIRVQPNADGSLPKIKADSDALEAEWVPLHNLPEGQFHDDHGDIINYFTGI